MYESGQKAALIWTAIFSGSFGALVGSSVGLPFVEWLFKWQTLITGFFAVAAAGTAYVVAVRQIKETRAQAEADRQQTTLLDNRRIAQSLAVFGHEAEDFKSMLIVLLRAFHDWERGSTLPARDLASAMPTINPIKPQVDTYSAPMIVDHACRAVLIVTSHAPHYYNQLVMMLAKGTREQPAILADAKLRARELAVDIAVLQILGDFLMTNQFHIAHSTTRSPVVRRLVRQELDKVAERYDVPSKELLDRLENFGLASDILED